MGLRTWLGLKRKKPNRAAVRKSPKLARVGDPVFDTPIFRSVLAGTHDKEDAIQFQQFAQSISTKCKSQIGQDAFVLWQTSAKRGGYFVEFGATNGVSLNNTYLLEKSFAWNGALAEPNRGYNQQLRVKRSAFITDKCVFSRSGETLTFLETKYGALSRLKDINPQDQHEHRRIDDCIETAVKTVSLNDLLVEAGAPREIDYISIDTEGSEFEILKHFDFNRWRVGIFTIEHNRTPMRQQIHDLLAGHGFRRKWTEISKHDDWYISV